MNVSIGTVLVLVVYLILMLAIGFVAYRRTLKYNDYLIGGRTLSPYVTALSAGASDMSGWLLLGLPGAIFVSGLVESYIILGLTVGAYINWLLFAPRLRAYTQVTNSTTVSNFLSDRFGGYQPLKLVASITTVIFFALYSASGMVSGAVLFEYIFNIPYTTALVYGAVVTIIYVTFGGFLGVSWTDAVQGTLMFLALIYTPFAIIYFAGGLNNTLDVITMASKLANIDYFSMSNVTFIGLISLLAWGLGYFGQPHILVRFIGAESIGSIKAARRISISWMILCQLGAVAVGFFGIAYFSEFPDQLVVANPERIFIILSNTLFHPLVTGFIVSAILAAIMSTLSSQILIASSSIIEDVYRMVNKEASESSLLTLNRIFVVVVAVVAGYLALDPKSSILKLVGYAWAGFGAAFGPIIILSLINKNINKYGAITGVLVGAITVIVWKNLSFNMGIYEIIPGFILSFISILVVSKLTGGASVQVSEVYQEYDKLYNAEK